MSTINLPDSLREFLDVSPTRQAIDAYLAGKGPRFISNVFSSPLSAPAAQREFDLFPFPVLPDGVGDDLLPPDPPTPATQPYVTTEWPMLGTVFVRSDTAMEDAEARRTERLRLISDLCIGLAVQWQHALALYTNKLQPEDCLAICKRLYLLPSLSEQPTPELIEELAHTQQSHHLLLLTAQHELGYLYQKVEVWEALTCKNNGLNREDTGLSGDDLSRLSARIRGRYYLDGYEVSDEFGETHLNAPGLSFRPTSDLAYLYELFRRWYRDVYGELTRSRCGSDNCSNFKPTGRKYCSERCAAEARRATYRKASKKYYDPKEARRKRTAKRTTTIPASN